MPEETKTNEPTETPEARAKKLFEEMREMHPDHSIDINVGDIRIYANPKTNDPPKAALTFFFVSAGAAALLGIAAYAIKKRR